MKRDLFDYESYPECFYCKHKFGILESFYKVQESIKPPRYSYRWKTIGRMCEDCESSGKQCRIENFN